MPFLLSLDQPLQPQDNSRHLCLRIRIQEVRRAYFLSLDQVNLSLLLLLPGRTYRRRRVHSSRTAYLKLMVLRDRRTMIPLHHLTPLLLRGRHIHLYHSLLHLRLLRQLLPWTRRPSIVIWMTRIQKVRRTLKKVVLENRTSYFALMTRLRVLRTSGNAS